MGVWLFSCTTRRGGNVNCDDEVHVYCPIGGKPCISW